FPLGSFHITMLTPRDWLTSRISSPLRIGSLSAIAYILWAADFSHFAARSDADESQTASVAAQRKINANKKNVFIAPLSLSAPEEIPPSKIGDLLCARPMLLES